MESGQFDSFSSSSSSLARSYGNHQKRRRSVSAIDEKIAAYMVKKAKKKAMHVTKKLKAAPTPYSNSCNPFGDSNLNEGFIWKKKMERDVCKGASLESYTVKSEKKRQKAAMEEIAKLKKRRENRALEKLKREEEIAVLARERAHAEFQDWEKKEQEFDLEQRKLRSEIRLRARRAKPIDILMNHLITGDGSGEEMDAGLLNYQPAYMVLEGLTVEELEEVRDDVIKSTQNPNTDSAEYWKALLEVCNWKLGVHGEESRGLYGVEEDVNNEYESKTHRELEQLHGRVESHFTSGKGEVVEFWEAALKKIKLYKAKAYLREFHAKIYGNRVITPNNVEASSIEPEDYVESGEQGLRKPKYYYRVHLGYEWNKYNRTHYDHHNPPPKVVQGYKFDVYYPDLLDKTKTPTFTLEEDRESGSSCIIRFHGGAPYEDVAFRIVNRDWEYKCKKGFRCTFEGGILRLYFNFKRYSYRR